MRYSTPSPQVPQINNTAETGQGSLAESTVGSLGPTVLYQARRVSSSVVSGEVQVGSSRSEKWKRLNGYEKNVLRAHERIVTDGVLQIAGESSLLQTQHLTMCRISILFGRSDSISDW